MGIWIFACAAVLGVYLFLIWPNPGRRRADTWRGQAFAHRGLHDGKKGVVENTLPAFEAACRKGYGIELDIQFSRDGQVVVFHDDNLARLTGDTRLVREVPLAELRDMRLLGVENARIPTLKEVLALVNGRVPLLIELKNGKENDRLCRALMEHLAGYPGKYIVESFNPLIVAWFRKNAPHVIRGQLCCPVKGYGGQVKAALAFPLAGLLLNCLARPDFIAYDANSPRYPAPRLQQALFHTPLAAWTVRDPALAKTAKERGEMWIFENMEE